MIDAFSKASRSFSAKGVEHNYSISLGYAEYPANAEKVSDILRYADIALYEVKLQGKHGALAYRPDFHNSKRTQLGFSLSDVSDNLDVRIWMILCILRNINSVIWCILKI